MERKRYHGREQRKWLQIISFSNYLYRFVVVTFDGSIEAGQAERRNKKNSFLVAIYDI